MEVKKIIEGMTAPEVAQALDDNFVGLNMEKANKKETEAKLSELVEEVGKKADAGTTNEKIKELTDEVATKADNETVVKDLFNLKLEAEMKLPKKFGKNLFDKNTAVRGYFINYQGLPEENDKFFYSEPIIVNEGESYYFNFIEKAAYTRIEDVYHNPIKLILHDKGDYIIPEGGKYLIISNELTEIDTTMVCKSEENHSYEEFTDKKDIMDLFDTIGRQDCMYTDFIEGVFISPAGKESSSSEYCTTPFIPIVNATYIECFGQFGNKYVAGLAFYDENKNFISYNNESPTGNEGNHKKTITNDEIPENAAYVRLSCYGIGRGYLKSDAWGGAVGDLFVQNKIIENSLKGVKEETAEVARNLDNTQYIQSKNLFNKATITEGYYIAYNGLPDVNVQYFYSDYIPVVSEYSYYINKRGNGAYYVVYDKDYSIIKKAEMQVGAITIPLKGKYLRVSTMISSVDTLQVELGTEETAYEEYYSYKLQELVLQNKKDINSLIGAGVENNFRAIVETESLSEGGSIEIPNTPDVKNNHSISFRSKVVDMGKLRISHGTSAYTAGILEVDGTNIYKYGWSNPSDSPTTVPHGLTISDYIHIQLIVKKEPQKAKLIITTANGQTYSEELYWNGASSNITAKCFSGEYTDCKLILGGAVWKENVWIFGDSYTDYWHTQMVEFGANKHYLLDGYSGRGSARAYKSLANELKFGTPEFVVWMMGMNDSDSTTEINTTFKTSFDNAKSLCESKNIKFIPCTIPNTPTRLNSFKNEYVKANSETYIDMADVLGATEDGSSWYDGLISGDDLHPSTKGAKLIAKMLCEELPQIVDLDD